MNGSEGAEGRAGWRGVHFEAVWLKRMWLPIDIGTGRPALDIPFPEALREAAAHRLPSASAAAGRGHTLLYRFPSQDASRNTPPARRILATYTCLQEVDRHGSGATFRVHYTDGTGRVQWMRVRWSRASLCWIPAATTFEVYPGEP